MVIGPIICKPPPFEVWQTFNTDSNLVTTINKVSFNALFVVPHSNSIFYVKNHLILSDFLKLKNINLGDQFLLLMFFENIMFKNNLF